MNDLAVVEPTQAQPVAIAAGALAPVEFRAILAAESEKRQALLDYIRQHFEEGTHFARTGQRWDDKRQKYKPIFYAKGEAPQRGDKAGKTTLLQPGAQTAIFVMRCAVAFRRDQETLDMLATPGLLALVAEVRSKETGQVVGEGRGCASVDDRRDPNTAIKMCQKRALVSAAINAFALSDLFTQDVEDMAPPAPPARPASPAGPRPPAPKPAPRVDPRPMTPEAQAVTQRAETRITEMDEQRQNEEQDDRRQEVEIVAVPPCCPQCGGSLWNNRDENDKRQAEGKKRRPDFVCKKDREHIIWHAEKRRVVTPGLAAPPAAPLPATPPAPASAPSSLSKQGFLSKAERILNNCGDVSPAEAKAWIDRLMGLVTKTLTDEQEVSDWLFAHFQTGSLSPGMLTAHDLEQAQRLITEIEIGKIDLHEEVLASRMELKDEEIPF